MKIWYFRGQYIRNGLGTNEISYNIFDLRHMDKLATDFQKKNKNVRIFAQVSKQRMWKILKNEAAESYLEPCHGWTCTGVFFQPATFNFIGK